ncbi:MAG: deoxynucleoside kinase [Candidatus Moeniiplasma glomeromycotorum]|nr:deoxynucleoside kinase [Candidatus Moeniiplasma glomeromycotorum]MCE8169402.1 deoxynucleoside kinase [Candidatus Moeniiplasma glomeromycotorum]
MLIVFVGIPGSGKSSLVKKLAGRLNAKYFTEPEEEKWADAAKDWKNYGSFSMLMWFRSIRVPMLLEAKKLSEEGEVVLIDTYYDKLLHYYLDKYCLRWLISPSDLYFEPMKKIAEIDNKVLPDANMIIFLEVNYQNWLENLKNRGRETDQSEEFQKNFETQKFLYEATQKYCAEKGVELISLARDNSSFSELADQLTKILESKINKN